jgi:hypothetical protein
MTSAGTGAGRAKRVSTALRPPALLRERHGVRANYIVLPPSCSGNVDHVVSVPVLPQELRRPPGERTALDRMPHPPRRSARRTNVVELDTRENQPSCVRVAVAVNFHAIGDKPPCQENTSSREAALQVEVVVDKGYPH